MAEENRSYFMIIAVVAVVAIVALVIMVGGRTKTAGNVVLNADEGTLVGDALAGNKPILRSAPYTYVGTNGWIGYSQDCIENVPSDCSGNPMVAGVQTIVYYDGQQVTLKDQMMDFNETYPFVLSELKCITLPNASSAHLSNWYACTYGFQEETVILGGTTYHPYRCKNSWE